MTKANKIIRLIALILLIITIVLAVIGTVLLFMNREEGTRTSGGYYDYITYGGKKYYYWVPKTTETFSYRVWKAGINPMVGSIFLLASLTFFLISKKKRFLLIGAFVSSFVAVILLYLSNWYLNSDSTAWTGYRLCYAGGYLASLVTACCVALFVLFMVERAKGKPKKVKRHFTNYLAFADELKDAKGLLDGGVFSQEEFDSEKARIFARYGFGPEAGAGPDVAVKSFAPTAPPALVAVDAEAELSAEIVEESVAPAAAAEESSATEEKTVE